MESVRNSRMKTQHELLYSREFQCLCCFHVRTGTIALGLIHVMMQMALVGVMMTALLNPELLADEPNTTMDDIHHGHKNSYNQFSTIVRYSKPELHYALLMCTFFGFVSMFLMYGAFWGQPSYLVPFFCIMCFDFANALLRLIGSVAERHASPRPPNDPLQGFFLMSTVIVKGYLLNMVWSCYKYLRLRQELLKNPPTSINGQPTMTSRPTVMEASHLLPDYDAAQKYPHNFYPAPPPPYATATQMPTLEQVVAPPPSYQDVAGTSQQVSLPEENATQSSTLTTVVTVNDTQESAPPSATDATTKKTDK